MRNHTERFSSPTTARNYLRSHGFEPKLDDQWKPMADAWVVGYEDGETEAAIADDGTVTFTIHSYGDGEV